MNNLNIELTVNDITTYAEGTQYTKEEIGVRGVSEMAKLKIVSFYDEDNCRGGISYTYKGKQLRFPEAEAEDTSLHRDFSDVPEIDDFIDYIMEDRGLAKVPVEIIEADDLEQL